MNHMNIKTLATAVTMGVLTLAGPVAAQTAAPAAAGHASMPMAAASVGDSGMPEAANDARKHVDKSLQTLQKMEKDPDVRAALAGAKGVFFIPDYGRGALIVGGQGGAGVLVVKQGGQWTGPGFYNFGGASIGLQAGGSAGRVVMILNDDKAVKSFAQANKFSLNADAGLTIVQYSARSHGDAGRGDVIVWSDTKGIFGNLSISVTDVNFDAKETTAYYGKPVSAAQVANGSLINPKASALLAAMPK